MTRLVLWRHAISAAIDTPAPPADRPVGRHGGPRPANTVSSSGPDRRANLPRRVVIFGDSLCMPRSEEYGGIPPQGTYPRLFKKRMQGLLGEGAPDVFWRGSRGRTIEDVVRDWHGEFRLGPGDVVIVHVGVVDCAPRVFSKREHAIIEDMRCDWLRRRILGFARRHRRHLVKLRPGLVLVKPGRFRRRVAEVIQMARASDVDALVFVSIISPPDWLDDHSPGFARQVALYNRILAAQITPPRTQMMDLDSLIRQHGGPDALTVDGIHINQAAHVLLGGQLAAFVLGG